MNLGELAARLGCKLEGDAQIEIHGADGLEAAKPGELRHVQKTRKSVTRHEPEPHWDNEQNELHFLKRSHRFRQSASNQICLMVEVDPKNWTTINVIKPGARSRWE